MSDRLRAQVPCPACGESSDQLLFSSVNGALLPELVSAIAAGDFERMICGGCGHDFQPEHPMLLSSGPGGAWIVMRPWGDRAELTRHEAQVTEVFERELAAAPPFDGRGGATHPRLVFGQQMLAEAVRLAGLGLAPALVECAKLLWARRELGVLMEMGPAVLCVEAPTTEDGLRCGALALADGRRVGTVELSRSLLEEVRAKRSDYQALAPLLFASPCVSAARYLYP